MASSQPQGPRAFALAIGLRAAGIGLLTFAAVHVALSHQFYATALVLTGVAVLIALDIARIAGRIDRRLAQFVDGLIAEGHDRPSAATAGAPHLAGAIDRALVRLARSRAERQRRIDYFQTLADNIQAALLVVDEAGRIEFANRAARRRLGDADGPLNRAPGLGSAADILSTVPAGSRLVVSMADGQRMLASVAAFASPGGVRRLIALQSVSGELDAVEFGAWQDLVRILSHEMMNSLTPILSLAEAMGGLIEDGRTDDVRDAVGVIARRSEGLMNFVERYRRLADLPPAAKVPIRLADFTGRIDALMSALIADKGIDYRSTVEPRDLIVAADPDLLEQAVINLIKNAFEAVAGQADPCVRLLCREAPSGVAIAVTDNGPGLDAAAADAAFIPFFTTKAGGSGIGLSLARQIALAHQGHIDHIPAEPRGARFQLLLPSHGAECAP